ncbi:MAG: alkaline phosphatase D family protein [Luteolibacter sp.]
MSYENNLPRRKFLILAGSTVGGVMTGHAAKTDDGKIVSLRDAHIGTLEIDLRIMSQYEQQPQDVLDFYTDCRAALTGDKPEEQVAIVCREYGRHTLGGPMLGDVTATSVSVWIRLPESADVEVRVIPVEGGTTHTFTSNEAARIHSVRCEGLSSDTSYSYEVTGAKNKILGDGRFVTAPAEFSEKPFKIAFGTCYHKVGMYRPELMQLIRERDNRAMLILGDSAVDGRRADYGLVSSDYLLRDLSSNWQQMAANVPVSATWDDHDYWGNDTSGTTTNSNKPIDVDWLRNSWRDNWNNPQRDIDREGIYFSTHIGPVHYIALDTRSCRVNEERGQLNCFLGKEQMDWLKAEIESSEAECILISGGTMWSDYISNGKDSWGTWDKEGREQIFQWIDAKKKSLVALVSGDRHGARGFVIPRPNGGHIYELEVACMGGVPGPGAHEQGREYQLFGYPGRTWAFGEFTFRKGDSGLLADFRLIDEKGKELETISLKR